MQVHNPPPAAALPLRPAAQRLLLAIDSLSTWVGRGFAWLVVALST